MQVAVGCLALLSLIATANGENYGVIVAGSTGWGNYRHQAGACHAYQVLHEHGIPDENIVVMMYDDLAYNFRNPTPGKVINQPNGPDVYEGIVKDYTGEEVTPQNFFSVLTGDEEAVAGVGSGKVIKSGPDDRIFVNMVDHGSVGLFAFPSAHMYADDLYDVIEGMHTNNQYKEMVMYMESCESGSMFDGIYPDNIEFYSTTSANPSESSYATYYDDERSTYIGDLYGCCWMENSDESDLNTLTLGEQYEAIKACNSKSHSEWYGQASLQDEVVAAFMGTKMPQPKSSSRKSLSHIAKDAVPSEDVPLFILKNKLEKATGNEKSLINLEISTLLKNRAFVRDTTKEIASLVTADSDLAESFMQKGIKKVNDWACYKSTVDAFANNCFNLGQNSYALRMVTTMLNLCENGYKAQDIISATESVCTFGKVTGVE